VQGTGFGVEGAGCRVEGIGFGVEGAGCRVEGIGFGVEGAGLTTPPSSGNPTEMNLVRTWCRV